MAQKQKKDHHRESVWGTVSPEQKRPDIKEINLSIQNIIAGRAQSTLESIFNVDKVDCFIRRCVDGGFKTEKSIQSVYNKRADSDEFRLECNGKLGSGKSAQTCKAKIILKVEIEYIDADEKNNSNIKE